MTDDIFVKRRRDQLRMMVVAGAVSYGVGTGVFLAFLCIAAPFAGIEGFSMEFMLLWIFVQAALTIFLGLGILVGKLRLDGIAVAMVSRWDVIERKAFVDLVQREIERDEQGR